MARFMDMLRQVDAALKKMDSKSVKRLTNQLVSQKIVDKLAHPAYKAFAHYDAVKGSWDSMSNTARDMMPKLEAWDDIQAKNSMFKAVREELEKLLAAGRPADSVLRRCLDKFRKQNDYVVETYGSNEALNKWGPIGYCCTKGVELIAQAEAVFTAAAEAEAGAARDKADAVASARDEAERKKAEKEAARKAAFEAEKKADADRDAAIEAEINERKAAAAAAPVVSNPNAGKIFISTNLEEFPGLSGGDAPTIKTGDEIHGLAMLADSIEALVPAGGEWLPMFIEMDGDRYEFAEERNRISGGGPAFMMTLVYDPEADGAATTEQNSGSFALKLAGLAAGEHKISLMLGSGSRLFASTEFTFISEPANKANYEKWAPIIDSKRESLYDDEKKAREKADREAFAEKKFDFESWVVFKKESYGDQWLKIGHVHICCGKGVHRLALAKGVPIFYSDGTGREILQLGTVPEKDDGNVFTFNLGVQSKGAKAAPKSRVAA